MITSLADERIKDVRVTNDELVVAFVDGRTLSVPLVWYPHLLNATAEQRNDWQLIGDGEGVHWPQIDEDLSAAGLLRGVPAPAERPHHPPAKESGAQAVNMAKDVYSDSIGEAKSKLQHDRSQLESLAEQIPREETKQRIQEMVDAYSGIEQALEQAAQDLGVEDRVSQTLQQAQEAGGQVAGQVAEGIRDEPDATEKARRRAEELRVDLSQIEGSGAKGRITVKDVTRAAHQ
jgi:pyruvate/2-oxoglutarate dehydrogenase complex dihydrolipoamide acyltransferase (E2) component